MYARLTSVEITIGTLPVRLPTPSVLKYQLTHSREHDQHSVRKTTCIENRAYKCCSAVRREIPEWIVPCN